MQFYVLETAVLMYETTITEVSLPCERTADYAKVVGNANDHV